MCYTYRNISVIHVLYLWASMRCTSGHVCFVSVGKYVRGRDEPDPKRWKANFRCALNSLADVLEVKDSSQKRGREAFKVYKFLPQAKKSRKHSTPQANSEYTTQTRHASSQQ